VRLRARDKQDVTINDTDIVSALRVAASIRIGPARFDFWFGGGEWLSIVDGAVAVTLPSVFYQDWVRSHFRRDLEMCVEEVVGVALPIQYRVLEARDDAATETAGDVPATAINGTGTNGTSCATGTNSTRPATTNGQPDTELRGDHDRPALSTRRKFAKLSDYVVGDSNRVAHASAEIATRRLGELNPLYLHGPTGVGKTHLLEGIWSAVRTAHRQASLLYLTAEQFTTSFLQALHGGGLPSFRRKYRHVDLLLIDDVQFFRGKPRTVEELLHTIDTLTKAGRQLVLAGDAAPPDLADLGPELVTRLNGGMSCRIGPPDYATRLGIVGGLCRDSRTLPECVRQYIAQNLAGSARELAGAVHRLRATSEALGQPITLATAEEALAELIRHSQPLVRLPDIERAVCEEFGLEADSLQSGGKRKSISHPRMLAMWLARKHTRAGLAEIGAYFGRRSHSTVVSAQQRVAGWMEQHSAIELAHRRCTIEEAVRRVEQRLRMA
jgi:chromosomal replication initiator protein